MRRLFRRRGEPLPPPGATPDEAATKRITALREEEVIAPPRGRPPRLWPWLLALLLLVLAGIAAAYLLTRDGGGDGGGGEPPAAATAPVPDVVGLRAEQATRRLVADGFRAQVASAPSERPRGVVVRQRPAAKSNLERGGTVTLVVSRGPTKVEVPDVVGLTLAQAFRRMEAAELRPRARRVFSNTPRGRVVRQRPAGGTELEREQVVLLTVSRGPERVDVPDLIGLSEEEAKTRLTSAGLEANVVRVASSEPAGSVVAQNSAARERVVRGSAVRVNISRGSSPVGGTTTTTTPTAPTTTTTTGTANAVATVPDVVSLDSPTAERRLRQAGFEVRAVSRETADPAEDGIVLDQRPLAGASAPAGAEVTITVGVLAP